MEFRILGALEVEEDGRALAPAGRRARGLLAALLVHANEPVSADRLIEEVWGDELPENAAKSLQIQISRLRQALGSDRVLTVGRGYRLVVHEGGARQRTGCCTRRAGAGLLERGEHAQAAESFAGALTLYRGPPLEEFADDEFARAEAARLEELRATAAEGRVDAELAQGRGAHVVGELQQLVAEHPFRERARGQLMVALYQAGRQADALAAYTDARRAFLYELGLEVGPELRELERRILNHDPTLGPRRPRSVFARHPRRAAAIALAIVVAVTVAVAGWASDENRFAPATSAGRARSADPAGHGDHVPRSWARRRRGRPPLGLRRTAPQPDGARRRSAHRRNGRRPHAARSSAAGRVGQRHLAARAAHTPSCAAWLRHRPPRSGRRALRWTRSRATGRTVWLAEQDSQRRAAARRQESGRIESVDNRGADSFFEGGARRAMAVGAGSLWVSNPVSRFPATDRLGRVSRIDLETGEVTSRIRVPAPPSALAADADAVWVGLERGRDLWRIDPRDDVAAAAVAVGGPVADLAIGEGAVWALETDGTLSRIDPATNKVTGSAELGQAAAIAVGHGRVWIATR